MIQNDDINLGPTLQFLASRWKPIFAVGFLFAAGGAVATIVAKPIWAAKATLILPPGEGGAAAALGIGAAKPSAILQGVLGSRPVKTEVAKVANLSMREVEEMVKFESDDDQGQLSYIVESEDRELATKMVNTALTSLERTRSRVSYAMAGRTANLLERVVSDKKRSLDEAEQAVLSFQKRAKSVPDLSKPFSGGSYLARLKEAQFNLLTVDKQIEATRSTLARRAQASADIPLVAPSDQNAGAVSWRDRLVQLEYDLQVAEIAKGPMAPDVLRLKEQIGITKQRAQSEVSKYLQGLQQGLDRNVAELEAKKMLLQQEIQYLQQISAVAPTEDAIVQRLLRNVRLREEEYKAVVLLLNEAQLKAQVDKLEWSVLAPAYIEDKPVNKRPVRTSLTWFVFGALITGGTLLVRRSRSKTVASA